MTRIFHAAGLIAVWLALWSDLSIANVAGGALVTFAVMRISDTRRTGGLFFRPFGALKFALYFLYKLVEASLVVARTVVVPRDRIRAGIVAVPLSGCSDALVTLIADAITLTPGTLTLEVRRQPLTLYLHVLHVHDVEAVRKEVRTLEVLAVEAFGSPQAIAGLAVDDSTSWEGRP